MALLQDFFLEIMLWYALWWGKYLYSFPPKNIIINFQENLDFFLGEYIFMFYEHSCNWSFILTNNIWFLKNTSISYNFWLVEKNYVVTAFFPLIFFHKFESNIPVVIFVFFLYKDFKWLSIFNLIIFVNIST